MKVMIFEVQLADLMNAQKLFSEVDEVDHNEHPDQWEGLCTWDNTLNFYSGHPSASASEFPAPPERMLQLSGWQQKKQQSF